jgi:hypothetical protein
MESSSKARMPNHAIALAMAELRRSTNVETIRKEVEMLSPEEFQALQAERARIANLKMESAAAEERSAFLQLQNHMLEKEHDNILSEQVALSRKRNNVIREGKSILEKTSSQDAVSGKWSRSG